MKNNHKTPVELPGINNIAISGRIGTGKSTLASHLSEALNWHLIDAGKVFRKIAKDQGFDIKETNKIPETVDRAYEDKTLETLENGHKNVVQSHLAGYMARDIKHVFKILVVCDKNGMDDLDIRIDRIMNRDLISSEDAKADAKQREESLVNKFRRLYVNNDQNWVYWDPKYFDLIVNTYSLNQKEALDFVLNHLLGKA